jgi:hypothetical protein
LQAQAADKALKGKGCRQSKGKDKAEKWKLIGPSEANFPAILTFSGADYTTSAG